MHEWHDGDKPTEAARDWHLVAIERAQRIEKLETLIKQQHGNFFGQHAPGVCHTCDLLSEKCN